MNATERGRGNGCSKDICRAGAYHFRAGNACKNHCGKGKKRHKENTSLSKIGARDYAARRFRGTIYLWGDIVPRLCRVACITSAAFPAPTGGAAFVIRLGFQCNRKIFYPLHSNRKVNGVHHHGRCLHGRTHLPMKMSLNHLFDILYVLFPTHQISCDGRKQDQSRDSIKTLNRTEGYSRRGGDCRQKTKN